jgi:hypothetical protein
LLIVCGVCFENDHFIKYALFISLSLLLGCVGRMCLLSVEIPDMHISLFYMDRTQIPDLPKFKRQIKKEKLA